MLFLETLAMRAWPAIESEEIGGWLLRAAGGCTKRANSVSALDPAVPFAGIVEQADRFYASRNLPTIFRVTPLAPPQCDPDLERRGFVLHEPSLVMSAPLLDEGIPRNVDIRDQAGAAWLTGVADANGVAQHMRGHYEGIVRSIPARIGCATLSHEGRAIGFALGVVEQDKLGLFNLVVLPELRGHGHGRALVQALSGWARILGATGAYLQVHAGNAVAIGLYESLGFTCAYRYHYRVRAAA